MFIFCFKDSRCYWQSGVYCFLFIYYFFYLKKQNFFEVPMVILPNDAEANLFASICIAAHFEIPEGVVLGRKKIKLLFLNFFPPKKSVRFFQRLVNERKQNE
jgi:hypothetical protein